MEHNNLDEKMDSPIQDQNKIENQLQNSASQTIIVKHEEKKSNGIGTAGFIMALIALFLGWIPLYSQILWLLGLIFSSIGIFKRPKGLAIAGLSISLLYIVIGIIVIAYM